MKLLLITLLSTLLLSSCLSDDYFLDSPSNCNELFDALLKMDEDRYQYVKMNKYSMGEIAANKRWVDNHPSYAYYRKQYNKDCK